MKITDLDTEEYEMASEAGADPDRKPLSPRQLRRRIRLYSVMLSMSMTLLVLVILAAVLFWFYSKKQLEDVKVQAQEEIAEAVGDKQYSQSDVDAMIEEAKSSEYAAGQEALLDQIRFKLTDGTSSMNLLRELYPDRVVFLSEGSYYFLPIDTSLKATPYLQENFSFDENGDLSYMESGTVQTKRGIDVSKFQGQIDWAKVKEAGIEYAIIRVGLRGYESGKLVEDECALANLQGAAEQGIPIGVYFFSAATDETEALEEAQFVLDMIEGYEMAYPVYLDIEPVSSESDRTKDMTQEERTDVAIAFLEAVKGAGYEPAIYGNLRSFMMLLDMARLEAYPKWFACYSMPVYFPYEYDVLQYSESGVVDGIPEKVDLNISFRK
ncbi:MAG: glycoside hydrolase family 25 protein [Lachnospiraceae bacterium]|nr:glycoside hydrolase family 25 protein [Lachnospiraceae bacterium]